MTDDLQSHEPISPLQYEALEDMVVEVFRSQLLMVDGEELSMDVSYFDLGLTSLRLTEIKQRLEAHLGLAIDATVLFNQPTVDDLLGYLAALLAADPDRASRPVDALAG